MDADEPEWQRLIDDIENRFAAERRSDLAAESADLAEAERGSVSLTDRLRGAVGRVLVIRTASGLVLEGRVLTVGGGVLELEEADALRDLVVIDALSAVRVLGGAAPRGRGAETSLAGHLRVLARAGTRVRLVLASGDLAGRVARVGADHLDLVEDGGSAGALAGASGPGGSRWPAAPGGAGLRGTTAERSPWVGPVTVPLARVEAVRYR